MARYKERLIREKIETTSGTAEATTAADAILCREVTLRALDANYTDQSFATGKEGAQAKDVSNKRSGADYQVEAAPPAVAGTPPKYAHLLKSSGWAEVDDGGDTVYTPLPARAAIPSCTLQMRDGAKMQTIVGVRGSVAFTAEVGKRPYFMFTRLGRYVAPVAFVPAVHDFTGWPRALECSPENMFAFTLGGVTLCVTSFKWADRRTPQVDKYMNCEGTSLGPRSFTGSMTVKHPDIAARDLIAMVAAATSQPLIWTLGRTAGKVLTMTGANVQLTNPAEVEIDGDLGMSVDLTFLPSADGADDEIEIRYS